MEIWKLSPNDRRRGKTKKKGLIQGQQQQGNPFYWKNTATASIRNFDQISTKGNSSHGNGDGFCPGTLEN